MGTYSSFIVCTTEEGYSLILSKWKERMRAKGEDPKRYDDPVRKAAAHDCVAFGWDSIKWYRGLPDVDCFEEAIAIARGKGIPVETLEACDEHIAVAYSGYEEDLRLHIEPVLTYRFWD